MQFTDSDDGHEIQVRVGDTFEVSLSETRTTGFSWSIKSVGEPVCSIVADSFANPSTTPGRSGTHQWTFKVDQPGSATIELHYARQWQKSAPARTYTLRIRAGA
ncbi:MAG TPA: protease inhibitor I42 family protein [Candidatus Binatus sp.]|uniref:protease inhibitor I42 family protein n=1 Tax=Candidatus Binatus sp. TaxID=2811406 RepID=UPI002B481986|nr:protease inhibitor I42 family protein [Candidatus Binatus sp.]HKN13654.1 protease inhibitor I42 family protein [Candidatus Binatus sp.]